MCPKLAGHDASPRPRCTHRLVKLPTPCEWTPFTSRYCRNIGEKLAVPPRDANLWLWLLEIKLSQSVGFSLFVHCIDSPRRQLLMTFPLSAEKQLPILEPVGGRTTCDCDGRHRPPQRRWHSTLTTSILYSATPTRFGSLNRAGSRR